MAEAPSASGPETLEVLQARHRKEQRDLVSRITQKKKQASKKTRKSVNEECENLERDLKERQARELAVLNGEDLDAGDNDSPLDSEEETQDLQEDVSELSIDGGTPKSTESSINGDSSEARKKKPNRAKARLARRAAEQASIIAEAEREAANAPNPRELERECMETQLQKHGLALYEIRADGHCLYAAVADQLQTRELGLKPKIIIGDTGEKEMPAYKTVRSAAADWIQGHADDFSPFIEDPLPEHLRKIRETGEWGGHLELLALARTYRLRICVLHSDGRVDKIEAEDGAEDMEEIWLGYYKHSHGLGEHYNSLRKVG
ncbi:OTU domain-containing protein 6B [Pyrenophora tritici-repentis Pt-1C-BFP]|nr:OTU domain-containing protein 6B [Pyrenophora tritici-repentis Pt-1C-BFP]EDU45134.1 OTU domain-containing protein 6B [Pyrenophora tritici-repentis Pt-1C-BFP]KAI0571576.1 OTU domain-containing protein 6B [Pyrenophora tritici-repentis]KAI1571081.1 cysteine protease OTU family [Pyrenophora tritici-repentis]KAI1583547.1 cysteine protease OTU family [Pyrenophora tritici-repentis]